MEALRPHLDALSAALTGPSATVYIAGAAGIVLILVALPILLRRRDDPMGRVRAEREGRARPDGPAALGRARGKGSNPLVERIARTIQPKDEAELGATRKLLVRAGYPAKDALRTLYAAQVVLGVGLIAVGVVYVLASDGLSPTMSALYAIGPGLAGYYAPKYWLQKRAAARQEEIQDGFPDALDLLLICVEAGQSIDQAIQRVAIETEPAYPALGHELMLVSHEMKAGRDKGDVMRAMADRVDLQDINAFVTVLVQAQSFGTSIAEALRVYAGEMRDKRVMRAEEKANVLPTKLTVGTMMFCVPPLLIILIGPSIFGIMETFEGGF